MTPKLYRMLLMLILLALLATACSLLQEPPAPSGELEAAPVAVESPTAEGALRAAPTEETVTDNEAVEEAPTEEAPVEETPVEEVVEETPTEDAPPADEEEAAAGGSLLIYEIDPSASQVRFELDEVLRGDPITVVGTTDQVAGEIAADLSDLSSTQVGEMRINARTLVTDNNFRNRALNNEILDTGDYEFITFVPTAVNGLPESAAVGDTVEFTIDGDLTIRDVTLPVTFAVTATPVSETELSGSAATVISRGDFNLTIPTVPNVADVEEQVELYIDFVANAS